MTEKFKTTKTFKITTKTLYEILKWLYNDCKASKTTTKKQYDYKEKFASSPFGLTGHGKRKQRNKNRKTEQKDTKRQREIRRENRSQGD